MELLNNSPYANDPNRVDFVAFWNNKGYIIFIDDISHYASKYESRGNVYWNAEQEKYTMGRKEDRKLRTQGWEVFRTTNWEIGNKDIGEIINDLLYFLGVYLMPTSH